MLKLVECQPLDVVASMSNPDLSWINVVVFGLVMVLYAYSLYSISCDNKKAES